MTILTQPFLAFMSSYLLALALTPVRHGTLHFRLETVKSDPIQGPCKQNHTKEPEVPALVQDDIR